MLHSQFGRAWLLGRLIVFVVYASHLRSGSLS